MSDLFDINGRKAIVTGGTRGLGRAMAEALLGAGAEVVIWGKSENVSDVSREYAGKGYKCFGVSCDLEDGEKLNRGFDEAVKLLGGRLDILVNAAGIQTRYPCEDFPPFDFARVVRVNLLSVFELCRLAGRVMLGQCYGKIINVASMLSFFGGHNVPAYAASKGGIKQLTKALSNEWAGKGICVNAVAPGYMETDMNAALIEDKSRYNEILSRIPAGRWGTPGDMKGVTLFLASSASDYVSGAIIPVDGGYLGK